VLFTQKVLDKAEKNELPLRAGDKSYSSCTDMQLTNQNCETRLRQIL